MRQTPESLGRANEATTDARAGSRRNAANVMSLAPTRCPWSCTAALAAGRARKHPPEAVPSELTRRGTSREEEHEGACG